MSQSDALEWLWSSQFFGIKLGLDPIRRLLHALGDPQERLHFLHVAGTNGKGSTCAMADSIARAAGLRTGLYTSPHLVDVRERFRVNGEKISASALTARLEEIRTLTASWEHPPTYFEITTALAIRHFADEQCDLVILETGMGGRLDATNAVTPLVSVLTPIDLDHMQYLGPTLTAIAGEKAGIIKSGIPVVSAPQHPEAAAVIAARAVELDAPLEIITAPLAGSALAGDFQGWNAALAVAALRAARIEISPDAITRGLAGVRWPGRFQRVGDRLVLDGSHNPHAARFLVDNWHRHFGDERAFLIFGAMADKEYAAMLEILAPIAAEFAFVPVDNPRAVAPSEFATPIPSRAFSSLAEALAAAKQSAAPVLVTGSLFLVGEALAALGLEP